MPRHNRVRRRTLLGVVALLTLAAACSATPPPVAPTTLPSAPAASPTPLRFSVADLPGAGFAATLAPSTAAWTLNSTAYVGQLAGDLVVLTPDSGFEGLTGSFVAPDWSLPASALLGGDPVSSWAAIGDDALFVLAIPTTPPPPSTAPAAYLERFGARPDEATWKVRVVGTTDPNRTAQQLDVAYAKGAVVVTAAYRTGPEWQTTAYSPTTGAPLWTAAEDDTVIGDTLWSPARGPIDPTTSRPLWTSMPSSTPATPTSGVGPAHDGLILLDGTLYHTTPGAPTPQPTNPASDAAFPNSTPLVCGWGTNAIVMNAPGIGLTAISRADPSKVLWSAHAPVDCTTLADNTMVIAQSDGSGSFTLVGIDPDTGRALWLTKTTGPSPTPLVAANGLLLCEVPAGGSLTSLVAVPTTAAAASG